MNKKQVAVILIVLAAVAGAAALYLTPRVTPTAVPKSAEESEVDEMFSELDDFLGFENQEFDTDSGGLESE